MHRQGFPGGLTEEHISSIGLITTEWTRIENQSQILLWQLVGLDSRVGRCITQHVSFRGLWDSIFSLLIELGVEESDQIEVKEIFKRIEKLRIQRNNIVHAIWGISSESVSALPGEATAITIKARGVLSIDHRNVPIIEMNRLIDNLRTDGLSLAEFGQKIEGKYVRRNP